jgi:hypothetical protein
MFDSFGPGTGFGGGLAAGGLLQDLLRGAGSYDDWARAALETATSAQASYRHHLAEPDEPAVRALARDLDAIGREAQRLAIVAENREYGEREVDLLRRLDRLCLRYTNGAPNSDSEPAQLLREELPDLVGEIFEALDDPATSAE